MGHLFSPNGFLNNKKGLFQINNTYIQEMISVMDWVTSATTTTALRDKSLAHSVDCWIINLETYSSIASLEPMGFLFVTLLSSPTE